MNQNHANLLSRLPAHSKTAAIRNAVESALDVTDRYTARRNEMAQSGQFTESGISAAVRDLLPATIRSLQTARSPIAQLKREIENKRASLRPADPDKSDLAGALERGEIRAHYRSLKPIERDALLMSTTDLRLIEAAVTAPPELSGFTTSNRDTIDKIEDRYIKLKHPEEVAELETLEALAAEAEAITTIARNGIRDTAKLEPRIFESEAKKIEAAVWLIGSTDMPQVCEVDASGIASYRPATADEVASGVRYANLGEYHAARAA